MADLGIRAYANRKFVELLPTRATIGNTAFRKNVVFDIVEAFGTSVGSACTHYNHAFIEARKLPELATLLEGLGRAEDKKGGRKPKVKAVVAVAEEVQIEQVTYMVCRKKSGDMVVDGLSFEEAQAMVNTPNLRVNGQFVGKLYWK